MFLETHLVEVCLHQRTAFVTGLVDGGHSAHESCASGHGLRGTMGAHVEGASIVHRQILRVHRAWPKPKNWKAVRIKYVPYVRADWPLILIRGDGGKCTSGRNLYTENGTQLTRRKSPSEETKSQKSKCTLSAKSYS
eukprot:18685-Prorocentrum_minimum.AAC.2